MGQRGSKQVWNRVARLRHEAIQHDDSSAEFLNSLLKYLENSIDKNQLIEELERSDRDLTLLIVSCRLPKRLERALINT